MQETPASTASSIMIDLNSNLHPAADGRGRKVIGRVAALPAGRGSLLLSTCNRKTLRSEHVLQVRTHLLRLTAHLQDRLHCLASHLADVGCSLQCLVQRGSQHATHPVPGTSTASTACDQGTRRLPDVQPKKVRSHHLGQVQADLTHAVVQ